MEFSSSATYGELQWENFQSLKFQETGFKSKHSSRSNSSGVEAQQQHNNNQMLKILSGYLRTELVFIFQSNSSKSQYRWAVVIQNWDDVNKIM